MLNTHAQTHRGAWKEGREGGKDERREGGREEMGRRDRAIRRETDVMSLLEACLQIEKPTQVSTRNGYTVP